jgi:hypothetical protein
MPPFLALTQLLLPSLAHADGGAVRTLAGQAGAGALLFLEIVMLHLSGLALPGTWRSRFGRLLFSLLLAAQYGLISFTTLSSQSLLVLPVAVVLYSILLLPFLALGRRLPRGLLIGAGWAAFAFLLALTLGIRLYNGPLFEWGAVKQELVFAGAYNWGSGPGRWFLGFFQDDFMRLFWWTLALLLVGGTFIVQALAGPGEPARKGPAKQLPLYAPRRGARRKRR